MLILITAMVAISLLLNLFCLLFIFRMESDVNLTRSDVIALRRFMMPQNIGGRSVPTPAELEAARNRIDAGGTAHPGGPG